MKKITNIDEVNKMFRQQSLHPLVMVGDLSRADSSFFSNEETDYCMYCIILIDEYFGDIKRGSDVIQCKTDMIVQVRPGQPLSIYLNNIRKPRGWMLAFSPELLENCGLGRDFYMFSEFFNQSKGVTLQLSKMERGIALNCMLNINAELMTERDYLSNHMIRLGIGQLLSYCKRFYERIFNTTNRQGMELQARLDSIIDDYLSSGLPEQQGQPTVTWCAQQFNLSPNYFGDLIKRELRITAQEYIHNKIIHAAQQLLKETTMSISEIGEQLGFTYSNHFTRLFKKKTGTSPMEYRRSVYLTRKATQTSSNS